MAWPASLFLLVSTRATGLRIELHHCMGVSRLPGEHGEALRCLGLRVVGDEGAPVTGRPAAAVITALKCLGHAGPGWGSPTSATAR